MIRDELALRLSGIVNLITSFPQLADAILIAKYSWDPEDEFRLRGWPPELLNAAREVSSKAHPNIYNYIFDTLEKHPWFSENYSDIIYHDASTGLLDPVTVYNYLNAVNDYKHLSFDYLNCIYTLYASYITKFTGVGIKYIRENNLAFEYKIYHIDDDEDENYIEEYLCTPVWAGSVLNKIRPIINRDDVKKRVMSEYSHTVDELKNIVDSGNPRCLAFIKTLITAGLRATLEIYNILELLEGEFCSIKGLIEFTPWNEPVINYALFNMIASLIDNNDAESTRIEAIPSIIALKSKGTYLINSEELQLVEMMLKAGKAIYRTSIHGEKVKVSIIGYR